jgi:protein ImuA
MGHATSKQDLISNLRKDMMLWEGFKPPAAGKADVLGLGPLEAAFPNSVFPTGTIHEFISGEPEYAAASDGFITGLLKGLMLKGGACLWIGTSRLVFPPALKPFGIDPDRIIFIDLNREKDILWVMEEALKCEGLAAVIGEMKQISFAESRRLQLATEKSRVTGFVIRTNPEKITSTACTARWKITPIPSDLEDESLPGVGYPRWNIELLKVRNGNPGTWQMEWSDRFIPLTKRTSASIINTLKAG